MASSRERTGRSSAIRFATTRVRPPWALSPTFVKADYNYVRSWTNDTSCAGSTKTSPGSNAAWLAQSVVDQYDPPGLGALPVYNYPNTAMAGWLCRSVQNPNNVDCVNHYNYNVCPNNSSSQGEIFYNNITASNSPPVYNVYAVDGCGGPEGAPQGNVPALTGNPMGQTAIQNHMTAQCFHPHTH